MGERPLGSTVFESSVSSMWLNGAAGLWAPLSVTKRFHKGAHIRQVPGMLAPTPSADSTGTGGVRNLHKVAQLTPRRPRRWPPSSKPKQGRWTFPYRGASPAATGLLHRSGQVAMTLRPSLDTGVCAYSVADKTQGFQVAKVNGMGSLPPKHS